MKSKKAFEFNFVWMFAIIAGAAILFLAIYATTKFVKTARYEIDTQTAAQLSILLDPLETSLEAGKSSIISFASETKIFNKCDTYGNFGKNQISISAKSGIGESWQEPGGDTKLYNKYIFSDSAEQGEEIAVFTMPFKMPFKVSDLMFFSSKKYCFVQAATSVKEDLQSLNLKNVEFSETKSNCSKESERVCFLASCDISVYPSMGFEHGYVVKNSKKVYYADKLVYGAIFASPEIYECNVKRLMMRLASLCSVYIDKIKFLRQRNCNSVLDNELAVLSEMTRSLNSSQEIAAIQEKAQQIEQINEYAVCRAW